MKTGPALFNPAPVALQAQPGPFDPFNSLAPRTGRRPHDPVPYNMPYRSKAPLPARIWGRNFITRAVRVAEVLAAVNWIT